MNSPFAYLFALASSTSFSAASLVFAEISRKLSPLWMNAFKALFAGLLFAVTVAVLGLWVPLPMSVLLALFASGILGLAIGDIFLLSAYARMGAARTMILYGFQPFFLGTAAHFLFGQAIDFRHGLAVIFFAGCLFTFSLEKFRQHGHWELIGLAAALVGVLFDNCGVLLSRWSFEQAPDVTVFQANLIRCMGAVTFFMIFAWIRPIHLRRGWNSLAQRHQTWVLVSVFLGTYMSLFLYLTAIKIGHLASVSAVGGAGPIITSAMECAYLRKRPSKYLLVALILFLCGFGILVLL